MNQDNQNYYAIIPSFIRYDHELSDKAKLLYAEITSLSNKNGYCYATNNYFANLFDISVRTVKRLIKDLKEKKYIDCENICKNNGNEVLERRIYIAKDGFIPGDKNVTTPGDKNVTENNIIKKEYNNKLLYSKESEKIEQIIDYLNNCGILENFTKQITFKFSTKAKETIKLITARLNEGYTVDDFKDVIYIKYNDFIQNQRLFNKKSSIYYYNPSTLFCSKHFENYKQEYQIFVKDN